MISPWAEREEPWKLSIGMLPRGLIGISAIDMVVRRQFQSIIEQCCHRLPPLPLRTLDAIHLATAVAARESEVVAADKRLREAAMALGFSVYPNP
jgi:hypothetical protein